MAWYRCSCGALKEATPRFGDAVVSIYHLHRSARLDGGSAIVLMEEIPGLDPVAGQRLCRRSRGRTSSVAKIGAGARDERRDGTAWSWNPPTACVLPQ